MSIEDIRKAMPGGSQAGWRFLTEDQLRAAVEEYDTLRSDRLGLTAATMSEREALDKMVGVIYDDPCGGGRLEVVAVRPDGIVIYLYIKDTDRTNAAEFVGRAGSAHLNWLPIGEFCKRVGIPS